MLPGPGGGPPVSAALAGIGVLSEGAEGAAWVPWDAGDCPFGIRGALPGAFWGV